MTLIPVEGGGGLILNLQVSTPIFFNTQQCEYVHPSFKIPKLR